MRIAVLDDYQNVARDMADWSAVEGDAEVTVFTDHLGSLDAAAAALQDFEIIAIMRERTPFPRALFERLPRLRLLVTTGARNKAIDLQAAGDHGVTVCGTPSPGRSTVELTWALILAAARNLAAEDRSMRDGGWQTGLGWDLEGKTLGVIGLGRLGSQVAEIGAAFRMEVIAWSPNLTAERAADCGARLVTRDDLFKTADVVTIHMVLSGRTTDLVTATDLARMKPTAWLVNCSRGPIVNERDLIDALRSGAIGGAALDVYDVEPLPADHPLRALDNTVLSPHMGYVTEETYRVFYPGTVEAIRAWLDGDPIRVIAP